MVVKSFPFNAEEIAPGVYDREYLASDFAWYYRMFVSDGLISADGQPYLSPGVEGGSLRTYVDPGACVISGWAMENTGREFLEHSLPEATADRIDRIVLRLDNRQQSRWLKPQIVEGEPAADPVPPALTRTNFIYELSVAQVRIRANTSTIDAEDLIDERLDDELCGLSAPAGSLPTEQLEVLLQAIQEQWDSYYEGKTVEVDSAIASYLSQLDDAETELQSDLVSFKQQFNTWFANQQTEGFVLASEKGVPNGVAVYNEDGKVLNANGELAGEVAGVEFDALRDRTTELRREVANLSLYQEVNQRIEGGATFGDIPLGEPLNMERDNSQSTSVVENATFTTQEIVGQVEAEVISPTIENFVESEASNYTSTTANLITYKADSVLLRSQYSTNDFEFTQVISEGIDLTEVESITLHFHNTGSNNSNSQTYFSIFPTPQGGSPDTVSTGEIPDYISTRRVSNSSIGYDQREVTIPLSNVTGIQYLAVSAKGHNNYNASVEVYGINLNYPAREAQAELSYTLNNTDEIVAWVETEGEVTVSAFLNDSPLDSSVENGEYFFSMESLSSLPSPKIRFVVDRGSSKGPVGIKRILGGIAKS